MSADDTKPRWPAWLLWLLTIQAVGQIVLALRDSSWFGLLLAGVSVALAAAYLWLHLRERRRDSISKARL
jgi:hypothetical protein